MTPETITAAMTPETITALAGLAAVLVGGLEMRLAVSRLTAKVDRIEERLGTVERKAERQSAVPAE